MAGGCASFEHQTTESEPHSVVRFVRAGDSGAPRREPSSIDGLSVRNGKDYRVRPGEHTVVFRFVETAVQTWKPQGASVGTGGTRSGAVETPATLHLSGNGSASVTGAQPGVGMQEVNLSMETRRAAYVTNSFSTETGWRYELNGWETLKTRIQP